MPGGGPGGGGHPLNEQIAHRTAKAKRIPQIALSEIAQIDDELNGKRLVQPIACRKRIAYVIGSAFTKN